MQSTTIVPYFSLKRSGRPIVDESARARVLAALASVDAVAVFDDPTPLRLILAVRPDVIVKEGDYNPEMIVGAKEVQSWGGEVRIVPTVEGFSTTRLIQKSQQYFFAVIHSTSPETANPQ